MPSTFRAVSDCYGTIAEIAFLVKQIDDVSEVEQYLTKKHRDILSLAGNARTLHVLVYHAQPDAEIRANRAGLNILPVNITQLPESLAYSYRPALWIQDDFIALASSDGSIALLEQITYTESAIDFFVADFLAEQVPHVSLKPFRYKLEGGNVLVGSNYALINGIYRKSGREYERMKDALGVDKIYWIDTYPDIQSLSKIFAEQTKTLLVALGLGQNYYTMMSNNRLDHIDISTTLAGRDEQTGKELVFVGRIGDRDEDDESTDGIVGEIINRRTVLQFKRDINRVLDAIADSIEKFPDFTVQRLPMALQAKAYQGRYNATAEQHCFLRSYNNCLVEIDGDHRIMYLPNYNSNDVDIFANIQNTIKNILANTFNIQTSWIAVDAHTESDFGGALRCKTKVIRRTS